MDNKCSCQRLVCLGYRPCLLAQSRSSRKCTDYDLWSLLKDVCLPGRISTSLLVKVLHLSFKTLQWSLCWSRSCNRLFVGQGRSCSGLFVGQGLAFVVRDLTVVCVGQDRSCGSLFVGQGWLRSRNSSSDSQGRSGRFVGQGLIVVSVLAKISQWPLVPRQ